MDILPVSPDDEAAIADAFAVGERARLVDAPDSVGHDLTSYTGSVRYGWDGDAPRLYVAREDGKPVGSLMISLPHYDNVHTAWFDIAVDPAVRRGGLGSELLAFGTEVAKAEERTTLGMDGWDIPAAAGFAERHGYTLRAVDVNRRQVLAEVDHTKLDALYDDARAAAADYELLRIVDAVPDDLLDSVVALTAAINDAPIDDLDIEDDVYTAERVRAFEHAMIEGRKRTVYRVVARHNETGELGGHSVVGVERMRPQVGWQLDTAVTRAHRGHRLGLLVKIDLLRWLAEAEPQLATIDTWNAESNQHMIAVNEVMGYRIIGRGHTYQRG